LVVVVPQQTELALGTLRAILKQTNVNIAEFLKKV